MLRDCPFVKLRSRVINWTHRKNERRVHLKITQWKRENHLNQTSIPGFNFCSLPGCNSNFMDSKMLVKMEPTFRQTFFSETFSWCPALASSRHGDKDMNKREETLAQNLGLFRMLSTTDKCPQSPTFRGGFPGASATPLTSQQESVLTQTYKCKIL